MMMENSEEQEQITTCISEMILNGSNKSEVITALQDTGLQDDEVNSILLASIDQIKSLTDQPLLEVLQSHIASYEEIYSYGLHIGHSGLQSKALKAKEKLLGLINTNPQLNIVNLQQTLIRSEAPQYDINRLTPDEQARMKELEEICLGGYE